MAVLEFLIRFLFEDHQTRAMAKHGNAKDGKITAELTKVLRALADPVRLEIVRQLSEGEKACGLFGIDMPKSSLSHHFRVLRQTGIIASETQGTVIMNRLQRDGLEERFPGLLKSILSAAKKA
jgi:DNA-binding transcriptional ArsR family regulator